MEQFSCPCLVITRINISFRIARTVLWHRDQSHIIVIISGGVLFGFFQTALGIVFSPVVENGRIALMTSSTSCFLTTTKTFIFREGVCDVSGSSGGNTWVPSILSFPFKIVPLFTIASLNGSFR